MQSGGGTQQGHGSGAAGHGRNNPAALGPPSSSASPASSSSAVSAQQLGFDSIQLQHQQQQLHQRQSLQQQFMRRPEANEAILAYQAGGLHGLLRGGNFSSASGAAQLPQQSKNFIDWAQQHNAAPFREEGQNKSQSIEQQVLTPVQQSQYALFVAQHQSAPGNQAHLQGKMGMVGPPSANDPNARIVNLKMQELMSIQASNQAQTASSSRKQIEETPPAVTNQISDPKPPIRQTSMGQLMQTPHVQQNVQKIANNQLSMAAQMQAMQALANERNIDLSIPANANLMAQLIPLMQSRMQAQHKPIENNMGAQSSHITNESSPGQNSSSDVSGQSGSNKARQTVGPRPFGTALNATSVNNSTSISAQQYLAHGRENQVPLRQTMMIGSGMAPVRPPQAPVNLNQGPDHFSQTKSPLTGTEALQMQYGRQLNRTSPQPVASPVDGGLGNPFTSPGGTVSQIQQQRLGFTKQQLHVLKAQILAFRRLKKGDVTLPQELLGAIAPPPLETQPQQVLLPSETGNQDGSVGKNAEDHARQSESTEKGPQVVASSSGLKDSKEKAFAEDRKANGLKVHSLGITSVTEEPLSVVPSGKEEQKTTTFPNKPEMEVEPSNQKTPTRSDFTVDGEKPVEPKVDVSDTIQGKKPVQATPVQATNASQPKDVGSTRKYHGPLFDFPFFTRKHDSIGSPLMVNNNLEFAYDVKDLLIEEGMEVITKKRKENVRKIGCLLAANMERKRIRPDLVLRLQIEERKLRLMDLQTRLRDEVDQQQQEIMAMPDRPYRKFVRLCDRQRMELTRQVQATQKAMREKQLKSIFQWRKKLLEAHWSIRDARTARNRGVAKYHERMLREFSKRKDDDRNKRMEALKNNDVERYREMLLEQQTSMPGDAAERYAVLSSFLSQTEEYLHKLGSKITAAKNQQEVEEAANTAAVAARSHGLSEEEVRAAATCAGEEVMIRNRFSEMNAPQDSSSVNKYYHLAHAVNERVTRQPSMLRAGTLRDYQLVGLQWMLSLYNNKLNGILADEMGLGKTVQVMALIAYLMEFKGNYGPHLIIVPNAVLVNWKSEFHNWLPSVSCIFYVGGKDQRLKLFSQEVCAMKFNVLVTTYEFIMYDRSKLSKVDWKYIIIDEAQRMKDRESVLARDLDRYRCQRRLLLTGTPLQNDLKELWSLLNLLLPEVFDNRKAFHDWFSKPFQKEVPTHSVEDDWLETEKKVIIIHRLHQILEPFMLRRRVEDVEGSLPPKVSIVLKCRMSAIQGTIYDWLKSTGTLRIDPEDEKLRVQKNPMYQSKLYKPVTNRCMELRKACNHPLLNYPYYSDFSKDFLVRSCGKFWVLDRILIKLQRTGHRVLLFSTMTRLLDLLEEYLQWRRLVYRRIDGTTSLEDRESAIMDFNSPDTDCFIFLLSIRAAGRGLNLQTADTVVIYDPDPNPKNEEQAVARAHRIGQSREVKVIYMEAVVDKIPSHQKEDELRSGGVVDSEDDLAGKDRYMGSIESLIRNNIQQYKIEMADEVINAGRFDQRTTHEERRLTLETLLHDEERYQETLHDVPSLHEVNRMIARSEEEVELFDQMDEELDWTEDMLRYDQVPKWLRTSTREVNATIGSLSKKPSKNTLIGGNIGNGSSEMPSDLTEKRRGRPKGKNHPIYTEVDDDEEEFIDASSEERNGYSAQEEEGDIAEFEEVEFTGTVGPPPINNDQSEEDGGYQYPLASEINIHAIEEDAVEEAGSSGSSLDTQKLTKPVLPSTSSQKFGSLSALDSRPSSLSKRLTDELEEGEIALSGDSHVDIQQSGSGIQDRDEGEDEQVLQPKIKRKRSIRLRPRPTLERPDEKHPSEKPFLHCGDSTQLPFQVDHKYETRLIIDSELKRHGDPNSSKHDQFGPSLKSRRNLSSRRSTNSSKLHASPKSSRLNPISAPLEDTTEYSMESWDGKVTKTGGTSTGGRKMSDVIQRKCKNVISKFQRRIDKEGPQIVPLLTGLWKTMESSGHLVGGANSRLDLQKIDQRVERFEYNGVMDFVVDVQFMLKSAMQYFGFSHEVRSEARKVHDLFFDILKIAFPDTDFLEARNSLTFSGSLSTSTSAPSLRGQGKRQKLINEVDPDPSPPQKSLSRVPIPSCEDRNTRFSPHPGELVICKKKRKDREKSMVKPGNGSVGPVSPPSVVRTTRSSSSPGLISKDTRLLQQRSYQTPPQVNNGGGGTVGWANPVKRLRTDAGKRRPSHL